MGRREAPPDDKLREAIHPSAQRKNGLLRRIRLRPKAGFGGQELLAMTKEGLYPASDQANALILMDCRVIPNHVGDRQ
jgi:hypothetical protein